MDYLTTTHATTTITAQATTTITTHANKLTSYDPRQGKSMQSKTKTPFP